MLNKLARGEQTIMVQHVTVNDGGQASLGQCQWVETRQKTEANLTDFLHA
jgi:hypothetical protein